MALADILVEIVSRAITLHSSTRFWIGPVVIFTFADVFVEESVDAVSVHIRGTFAVAGILVEITSGPPTRHSSTWWRTNTIVLIKVSISTISTY